jgi:DNA mismatch repair ATPase MutS/predicted GIY-YIG superfamily endonuclease
MSKTKKVKDDFPLEAFAPDFWNKKILSLNSIHARREIPRLDLNAPHGIDLNSKGINLDGPVMGFMLDVCRLHPEKIILVQIGDFLEAYGYSALCLIGLANLKPMGTGGALKAGFPCSFEQTRRIVRKLVEGGLSVVICLQEPDKVGHKSARKTRFIADIVTPASPEYVYGAGMEVLDNEEAESNLEDNSVILALVEESSGFSLYNLSPDRNTLGAQKGLTLESVSAQCASYPSYSPLYFFISKPSKRVEFITKSLAPRQVNIRLLQENLRPHSSGGVYNSFELHMLETLSQELSLTDREPQLLSAPDSIMTPIHESTAGDIGVIYKRGVPSLIDFALPADAPVPCKTWMRGLLLSKITPSQQSITRRVLDEIKDSDLPLPKMNLQNLSRLLKLLRKGECSPFNFNQLKQTLSQVMAIYEISPALFSNLKNLVASNNAALTSPENLADNIQELINKIAYNIKDESDFDDAVSVVGINAEETSSLDKFFERNESTYRNRINRQVSPEAFLVAELRLKDILDEIARTQKFVKDAGKKGPLSFSYDNRNNLLFLQKNHIKHSMVEHFVETVDRNDKPQSDKLTTVSLKNSSDRYIHSTEVLQASIRDFLKQFSSDIYSMHSNTIYFACSMAVIFESLHLHVREAQKRLWGAVTVEVPDGSRDEIILDLVDFFPYWMSPKDASTVTNTLTLSRYGILTGPNASGKSSLIRSLVASCLLSQSGLYAPVARGRIPFFNSIHLRTGSEDFPELGLSSFANEMREIGSIMASSKGEYNLICLDEIGRGTGSSAGVAFSVALLEHLTSSKTKNIGLFSTHLTEIYDLDNKSSESSAYNKVFSNTERYCMGLKSDDGEHKSPTWKILKGICFNSLAYEVALQQGIDPKLVSRAREIERDWRSQSGKVSSTSMQVIEGANNCIDAVAFAPEQKRNTDENPPSLQIDDTNLYQKKKTKSTADWPNTKSIIGDFAKSQNLTVSCEIKKNELPPPKYDSTSALYVLVTSLGLVYVGETDCISRRLKEHQNNPSRRYLHAMIFPVEAGKSRARDLESFLISTLKMHKVRLASNRDDRS